MEGGSHISYKTVFVTCLSLFTNAIAFCFGGWNVSIGALIVLMTIDFITGMIVAAVFGKSNKTESGKLSSKAFVQGLARKVFCLCFVIIGNLLDVTANIDYCRNFVVLALIANEVISIAENSAIAGVPMPQIITKVLDILTKEEKL